MLTYDLDESSISIYDELGPAYWGLIDAAAVEDAIRQMKGKHITLRINTPGGSVDEGISIYNLLQRHKPGVTTIVDSLAASMGSYLMQVGERRIVASNSMMMVHEPWTITMGNSDQLRKDAEVLDKYALRMIPDYARRSGKTDDEILAIMAEETWYAGQEIVDAGFADELQSDAKALASTPRIDGLQRFAKKMPAALLEYAKENRRRVSLIMQGIEAANAMPKKSTQPKQPRMSVEEARLRAASIA